MSRHTMSLGTLTIPTSAGAGSNIAGFNELQMCVALVFYSPAAYTGTISVEVADQEDAVAGDMKALYNNGSAVVLTQGRVEKFDVGGFKAVRVKTSGTEAGSRDVKAYAILDIPD